MDSLTDAPPEGGTVSLDHMTSNVWQATQTGNMNSSTLLYIAVSPSFVIDKNWEDSCVK